MEELIEESETPTSNNNKAAKKLYRTLWRWHFYAGVFAIPFVIILSITGALYLFKPQLDAIHDKPYRNLTINNNLSTPEQQVAAALAAVPGAHFIAYELPREATDAINILLNSVGKKIRVYIHPCTLNILATENEDTRFLQIVHDIHGELLLGKTGSLIVELAACWAIVLVLTGVYLWWPRNARGLAGIVYPRIGTKGRLFWRDLHSVIAIWISFFVLFLLISGLPWALVWGSAFKEIRQITGTVTQKQDWIIAGKQNPANLNLDEHAEHHDHPTEMNNTESIKSQLHISLTTIVAKAQQLHFAYPVLVSPPSLNSPFWSVKSNAQNRPLREDAFFNSQNGQISSQQNFSQRHVIDRAIGIGVAAHEGQLFGWLNQLLGLLTAIGLIIMSIAGFMMWRKRAPTGLLGAPPAMPEAKIGMGFVVIILIAAILLPVLGASLIIIAFVERLILSRWIKARIWLGIN